MIKNSEDFDEDISKTKFLIEEHRSEFSILSFILIIIIGVILSSGILNLNLNFF